jgi:hypothetical protein
LNATPTLDQSVRTEHAAGTPDKFDIEALHECFLSMHRVLVGTLSESLQYALRFHNAMDIAHFIFVYTAARFHVMMRSIRPPMAVQAANLTWITYAESVAAAAILITRICFELNINPPDITDSWADHMPPFLSCHMRLADAPYIQCQAMGVAWATSLTRVLMSDWTVEVPFADTFVCAPLLLLPPTYISAMIAQSGTSQAPLVAILNGALTSPITANGATGPLHTVANSLLMSPGMAVVPRDSLDATGQSFAAHLQRATQDDSPARDRHAAQGIAAALHMGLAVGGTLVFGVHADKLFCRDGTTILGIDPDLRSPRAASRFDYGQFEDSMSKIRHDQFYNTMADIPFPPSVRRISKRSIANMAQSLVEQSLAAHSVIVSEVPSSLLAGVDSDQHSDDWMQILNAMPSLLSQATSCGPGDLFNLSHVGPQPVVQAAKSDAMEVDADTMVANAQAMVANAQAMVANAQAMKGNTEAMEVHGEAMEVDDSATPVNAGAAAADAGTTAVDAPAMELKTDSAASAGYPARTQADLVQMQVDSQAVQTVRKTVLPAPERPKVLALRHVINTTQPPRGIYF